MIHLEKKQEQILKDNMPSLLVCNKLADFYSLFSDSTRIKILITLILNEMCVNDLSKLLDINQTTISHQLKILKASGLINCYRKNKFMFYSIKEEYIKNTMLTGLDFLIKSKAS